MSQTSYLHINLKTEEYFNRPIEVAVADRRLDLAPLYRVIAIIPEFVQFGVAGMVVNGSFTVYWSTGIASEAEVEYGYIDDSNLTTVVISEQKKYHSFVFPATYVDTDHVFRITSINPITGERIVSELESVYISSDVVLRSTLKGMSCTNEAFIYNATVSTQKGIVESVPFWVSAMPEGSSEAGVLQEAPDPITFLSTNDASKSLFQVNITTTIT